MALINFDRNNLTIGGFGIGSIIACLLSWTINHSILWAVIHFCCSWVYVVFYLFKYSHLL